ncbi:MAG: PEP-CTERM sorting domain-containing protein [Deltaproteobacteria bacterium]|nr:MAG: PEP-CTERM sorting domain-containing protein [Deltaproteobacteria bacterium]
MKRILMIAMALVMSAGVSFALVPVGDSLQTVLDDITVAPNIGDSSVDVHTDMLSDDIDTTWTITGTGGSVSSMIVELASFADYNQFGVYNGDDYVIIFDGTDTAGVFPGTQATLTILANGDVYVNGIYQATFDSNNFGYYLEVTGSWTYELNGDVVPLGTPPTGGEPIDLVWHSDTSLNGDGEDHMVAYAGTNTDTVQIDPFAPGLWTNNEYILAFEDLPSWLTDSDFTDFVVMVESVSPVPEPATLLLMGGGLAAFAAARRRRKK